MDRTQFSGNSGNGATSGAEGVVSSGDYRSSSAGLIRPSRRLDATNAFTSLGVSRLDIVTDLGLRDLKAGEVDSFGASTSEAIETDHASMVAVGNHNADLGLRPGEIGVNCKGDWGECSIGPTGIIGGEFNIDFSNIFANGKGKKAQDTASLSSGQSKRDPVRSGKKLHCKDGRCKVEDIATTVPGTVTNAGPNVVHTIDNTVTDQPDSDTGSHTVFGEEGEVGLVCDGADCHVGLIPRKRSSRAQASNKDTGSSLQAIPESGADVGTDPNAKPGFITGDPGGVGLTCDGSDCQVGLSTSSDIGTAEDDGFNEDTTGSHRDHSNSPPQAVSESEFEKIRSQFLGQGAGVESEKRSEPEFIAGDAGSVGLVCDGSDCHVGIIPSKKGRVSHQEGASDVEAFDMAGWGSSFQGFSTGGVGLHCDEYGQCRVVHKVSVTKASDLHGESASAAADAIPNRGGERESSGGM
jgi:hypothetical protein